MRWRLFPVSYFYSPSRIGALASPAATTHVYHQTFLLTMSHTGAIERVLAMLVVNKNFCKATRAKGRTKQNWPQACSFRNALIHTLSLLHARVSSPTLFCCWFCAAEVPIVQFRTSGHCLNGRIPSHDVTVDPLGILFPASIFSPSFLVSETLVVNTLIHEKVPLLEESATLHEEENNHCERI